MTIDAATMKKLRKWDDGGMTRREMARRSGISAKTLTKYLGPKDRKIGDRPRVMVNVWTHREDFRKVAQMAKDLGYTTSAGHTAGSGSVGLLIEALAAGDVALVANPPWEENVAPAVIPFGDLVVNLT